MASSAPLLAQLELMVKSVETRVKVKPWGAKVFWRTANWLFIIAVYVGGGDGVSIGWLVLGRGGRTYGEIPIADAGGRGQDVKVDLDVDGLSGFQDRVVVFCLLGGKRLGDLELLGSWVPGSAAEGRGSDGDGRGESHGAHQGRGNKGEETHVGCM